MTIIISYSDIHATVKDADAASFATGHPRRDGRLNAEALGLSASKAL